ncbi:MAG: hypothetical protein ABFQ65_02415 [Nanoarchaeota archaeon]
MGFLDLPIIENRYSFDTSKVISESGTNANVYFIDEQDDICAKILKKEIKYSDNTLYKKILLSDEFSARSLIRRYRFMMYVFHNGAKVPTPFGVFNLEDETGDKFPGFVAQYDDKYLSLKSFGLEWDSFQIKDLVLEQEELIQKMGFAVSLDFRYNENILWNPEKKDIRIIDAGVWAYYGNNRDFIWSDELSRCHNNFILLN